MSQSRALRRFGSDRGQTASEYMGVLLIVAVLIGALAGSELPGQLARAIGAQIAKIDGAGPKGGGKGGGKGAPGAPGQPGAPGAGAPNDPNAAADPNAPGAPGDPGALAACLSTATIGYCAKVLDPARYFVETRPNAQLDRIQVLTKQLTSGGLRTGTPEFNRVVAEREKAVAAYLKAKKLAGNPGLRAVNRIKQVVDPRIKDFQAKPARKPLKTPSGSAARRVLDFSHKHGSKMVKGAGITGAALSAYTNVKKEGVGKGLTQTAGSIAGGYGAGAIAATGCAALAVTGVGAVACGVGVVVIGVAGSELGKRAAGAVYDGAAAGVRKVSQVATGAAKEVYKEGKKVLEKGRKVASALNPFD